MRRILPVRFEGAVKPGPAHQINQAHPLARGLLGFWLLNESGNRIYNAVKGTPGVMGAGQLTWVPGPDGLVASFDGTAQINVGTDSGAKVGVRVPSIPFTIVGRARATSLPGPFMNDIFVTDQAATVGGNYSGARLAVDTSGKIRMLIGDNAGNTGSANAGQTIGTTTINANEWHTIGASCRATQLVDLFLDGKPESSSFTGNTVTMGLTANGWAGIGASTLNGGPWNGQIAWVGIWARSLKAWEQQLLHEDPYAMFAAGSGAFVSLASPNIVKLSQEAVEALYGTSASRARLSQEAIEALYNTSAKARVSQVAFEVLVHPAPANHLSQLAVELLVHQHGNQLSQVAVESLYTKSGRARLSQEAVEALLTEASTARLSQVATEVLLSTPPGSRISQVAVEVLRNTSTPVGNRLSQVAVEVLRQNTSPVESLEGAIFSQANLEVTGTNASPDAVFSQAALEVLRPWAKDLHIGERSSGI